MLTNSSQNQTWLNLPIVKGDCTALILFVKGTVWRQAETDTGKMISYKDEEPYLSFDIVGKTLSSHSGM
jgi:hypothetical protein